MEKFWLYAGVFFGFAVLFVSSRGFFGSAARLINRRFLMSLSLDDAVVREALVIVFIANLLGCMLTVNGIRDDTVARGYLLREEYGGIDYEEDLVVTVGDETRDVTVDVEPRVYTEETIEEILDDAEAALPEAVLGEMNPGHVDADVNLVTQLPGLPVMISWMVDKPEIIDWDGHIGDRIPEAGERVTLYATISLEEHIRGTELAVTAFSRAISEEERFDALVREAISDRNDASEERLYLPEEVGGQRAAWQGTRTDMGRVFLGLGILISLMMILSKLEARRQEEEARQLRLLLDYPHIVSKLMLLLGAGLSLRQAFQKMAEDYQRSLEGGGQRRAGFEEIVRACTDMANGLSESQAYWALGQRAHEVRYKTFAALLTQNLRRGSGELVLILEQEAAEAFDERKKQARILGEQAGTRLTFPMFILLGVVMVILMVPAFVSF